MTMNYVNFFCGYFSNIISNLQIPCISKNISNVADLTDPVSRSDKMFQDHPSINPLMPVGNKKFRHTDTNLQLKAAV